MSEFPKLKFPAVILPLRERNGKRYVPDRIRGGYLLLTPEEWVRRHVIEYLTGWCGVELQRIITEYPVLLNGQPQRADIVVVGQDSRPQMLVECKAADVEISQAVLDQAVRYNSIVGAHYLMLTNGLKTFCFESLGEGRYARLNELPKL
ncbi:MAG: type I restriction enzyme HsdR N-terminal domain-containing protein [Alistipes sp.]|nr:type I restriction enzyme HsdR N-terminal domain-containing protein [Alistipes sp.]